MLHIHNASHVVVGSSKVALMSMPHRHCTGGMVVALGCHGGIGLVYQRSLRVDFVGAMWQILGP